MRILNNAVPTPQNALASGEQSIKADPNESNSLRAQQFKLCPSTSRKILRKHISLRVYKNHLVQDLKANDHQALRTLGKRAQTEMATHSDFYKTTYWTKLSDFELG